MGKTFNMRGGQSGGAPGAYARIIINANANANVFVEHNGVVKSVPYKGSSFVYKATEYGDYHVYGTLDEYSNDGEVVEVIEATDYTVALRFSNLPNGTVAYWPFEEDAVDIIGSRAFTLASGSAEDWYIDDSGPGPYGGGALTVTRGTKLSTPFDPQIAINSGRTIEFWAQLLDDHSMPTFFGNRAQVWWSTTGTDIYRESATTKAVSMRVAGDNQISITQSLLQYNEWHHVSLNFDNSDGKLHSFIDGANELKMPSSNYSVGSAAFVISQSQYGTDESLYGFRMYGLLITDGVLRTAAFDPPSAPYVLL